MGTEMRDTINNQYAMSAGRRKRSSMEKRRRKKKGDELARNTVSKNSRPGKRRKLSQIYQKHNVIPVPRKKSYPEKAIPPLIRPDKTLNLISGKTKESISDLLTAVFFEGQYLSFDEVVTVLKSREHLEENDDIMYIGKGRFAVINYENKNNKKQMNIKKVIAVEIDPHSSDWRQKLQLRVDFVTIDTAATLSQLYTSKEMESFTEFNQS